MSDEIKVEQGSGPDLDFLDLNIESFEDGQTAEAQPSVVSQELNIGGETIRVEAASHEELYKKVEAASNEILKKKLFEPSSEETVSPLKVYEPYEPSDDDLSAIVLQLQQGVDPVGAFRSGIAAAFGVPFEAVQEGFKASQDLRQGIYIDALEKHFVAKHPDFFPCAENREMIYKYMESKNMELTPEAYDEAYNKTQTFLKKAPAKAETPQEELSPSALSGVNSMPDKAKGSADIDAILKSAWNKPLDQLEKELKSRPR